MLPSFPFDPDLHEPGSRAAEGRCTQHEPDGPDPGPCDGEAVVSFEGPGDRWRTGCARALEQLVERGDIEPLGQGA